MSINHKRLGILTPPSNLITLPLIIGLMMMDSTRVANSGPRPRRRGYSIIEGLKEDCFFSSEFSEDSDGFDDVDGDGGDLGFWGGNVIPLSKRPGAIPTTRIPALEPSSRARGRTMLAMAPLLAE